jgi:hypothetical protein
MFNLSYTGFTQAWRRHASTGHSALLAELNGDAGSNPDAPAPKLDNGAILASLALLTLGIPVAGSRRIDAGPLTGGRAFTGANAMADWLGERFAPPETLPIERGLGDIADRLFGRRGIVAFVSGNGPQGGLIGLLEGSNAHTLCAAAQARHPLEVRFWALN